MHAGCCLLYLSLSLSPFLCSATCGRCSEASTTATSTKCCTETSKVSGLTEAPGCSSHRTLQVYFLSV